MNLYKYLSPNVVDITFTRNGFIGLKCSFPKDYNDPCELTINMGGSNQNQDVIAYFYEILGDLPQLPTTCFSKKPDVVPMWAHYADEHTGIVVELEEKLISEYILMGFIGDVTYADKPDSVDLDTIHFAWETKKASHTHNIQTNAYKYAYFTKHKFWEYENERRLIVSGKDIEKTDTGLMIIYLPLKCVKSIISGVKAENKLELKCRHLANEIGCDYYRIRLGRNSYKPFYINEKQQPYIFNGTYLEEVTSFCNDCLEPIINNSMSICPRCSLDEEQKENAALDNPIRLLDYFNLRNKFYPITLSGVKPIGKELLSEDTDKTSVVAEITTIEELFEEV